MVDIYADKDAWVAQLVGGTAKYGNGTGTLVTVGPAPNATSGSPDFKGRGLFQFPLTDIIGFSAIVGAEIELTVAPTTCIGSRGNSIRILFELALDDFNEANEGTSNPCQLGSGTGIGRWPGPSVSVADRGFYSASSHATGDKVTVDLTNMLQAVFAAGPPASGTWYLRIRAIAANGTGTDYDESNAARRITFYTREDEDLDNHPVLRVDGSTSSASKSFTDTGYWQDSFAIQATTGDQTFADTGYWTDSFTIDEWATIRTTLLTDENGVGEIVLPATNTAVHAYLDGVETQDVLVSCRFQADTTPSTGAIEFHLLTRYIDSLNHYRLVVNINHQQRMSLLVQVIHGGAESTLATLVDARTFLPGVNYICQLRAEDTNPTQLLARLWREGELIPGWVVGYNDSVGPQGFGSVGLGARVTTVDNAPITFVFDEYTGQEI